MYKQYLKVVRERPLRELYQDQIIQSEVVATKNQTTNGMRRECVSEYKNERGRVPFIVMEEG
jgi:hypothetical protein